MMFENEPSADSPIARARRIREIRNSLKLSRPKFAERLNEVLQTDIHTAMAEHPIPLGTLQNWEEARFGGLSQKGAKSLIKRLYLLGIECTVEWLMYGTGNPPLLFSSGIIQKLPEEKIIEQELKLFYQLNPNAVDTIIRDDSMLPQFERGDHVAGRRYFVKDIDRVIGKPCIIHTENNSTIIVSILKQGNKNGFYSLDFNNPSAQDEKKQLENIKLFSAAPILWIRRKGIIF